MIVDVILQTPCEAITQLPRNLTSTPAWQLGSVEVKIVVGGERNGMETPRKTIKRRARRTVALALKSIRTRSHTQTLPPTAAKHLKTPIKSTFDHDFPQSGHDYTLDSVMNNLDSSSFNSDSFVVDSKNICSISRATIIQNWAIDNAITHIAVNELLSILREWLPHDQFPKNARTLLKTPRKVEIIDKAGGQYYYFGIRNHLISCLKNGLCSFKQTYDNFSSIGNLITLKVGIDGVPVSKSSNLQFWPVLFSIDQDQLKKVYIASLFYGTHKPNSIDEFLFDFVSEMQILETSGILFNEISYSIRIRCIIADAPARSFIKCIKNHNAYYGCERCYRKGKWRKRVIYPVNLTGENYSDDSFRMQLFSKHHNGTSPLINLELGLVSQIPLDYLHLCCLGIMKKLLLSWIEGPGHFKLRRKSINLISERLLNISIQMPKEFSRKTRGLSEIRHWKGTEFRTFMLYVGPFVLKEILSKKIYKHFLLFHVAMYIMCLNAESQEWLDYASKLLTQFVNEIPKHYHSDFLSYNMHSLQHLPFDVKNHGCLDRFSAFEFESYLYKLKRMLRTNNHHLKQVVHRVLETENVPVEQSPKVVTACKTKKIDKNSYYLLKNGSICRVKKVLTDCIIVNIYSNNTNLEHYPCNSSLLSIVELGKKSHRSTIFENNFYKRCLALKIDELMYIIPLGSF